VNNRATIGRLRRMVRDFRFAPARDVLARAGTLVAGGVA
jgi:hypothetical protein